MQKMFCEKTTGETSMKISNTVLCCLWVVSWGLPLFAKAGDLFPLKEPSQIIEMAMLRNKLPDNFSLVYNQEHLEKGKWVSRKKVKLLWDFKEKRARIISLETRSESPPDVMQVTKRGIGKKTAFTAVETVFKNEKNFDVTIQNPKYERYLTNSPRASIRHPVLIAGGGLNSYINLFYTFVGSVPLKETLEKDRKALDASMKKIPGLQEGDAIDVTFKKGNETMICTFDSAGVVRQQSLYRKSQKKDGSFTESRRIHFWDIKQSKQFNGFQFPLVLEGEIVMSPWLPYEKTIKRRITVEEKSIRVNQDLTEADFLIKIPVGAHVTDERKGISYESDGLDSELEESLSEALEAAVRKAKAKEK
jgi:hypothetical protein